VTVVQNGKVVGGREFTNLRLIRQRNKFLPEGTTNKTKLSAHGKAVFAKYATNFDDGSVGAWADIMQHDNYYGALVIFSDFQDGIRIVNSRGESVETTTKTANSWDERWVRQFAGALTGAAPKLYLFSIQRKPQEVWQRCVEASGGEIKMMPELRSGGDFIGGAIGAPIEAPATGKVRWTDKLAAAKGEAKSKKKNLLLLFTASGNSACQTLQDNVLNTAKFEDAVESKYITVKFDCTKSFHHRDLRTKYSVTEFPTIVLTTPDGTVIKHITGNAATSLQELISNL
jgi:hypothetical protein